MNQIIEPPSFIEPGSFNLKKREISEQQQEVDRVAKLHDFYKVVIDHGKFKDIALYRINFLERLKLFGFFRFDLDNGGSQFIQIEKGKVSTINETFIIDTFFTFLEDIPPYLYTWKKDDEDQEEASRLITTDFIKEKMLKSLDTYFSKSLLNRLTPDKPIEVKTDTQNEKFLYYKNGFVTVTKEGSSFQTYDNLNTFIWKDQMLKRPFGETDGKKGFYEQFIFNICGHDKNRFTAMQSIIGYNLHNYTRRKLFATVLTDSRLSNDGEANGRTGKTLWGKGLGHMLNTDDKGSVYIEINGRDFEAREAVKYTACNLNTTLVHINDCKNRFNIENLFNDITDGIKVKKLFQDPFTIHPKIILSSNQTIIIEGESAKDRVIQFEFSDYYSSERSPATEFNHWFFDDWDVDEWYRYDDFMIQCIKVFLDSGVIRPGEINLNIRVLQDHTAREFLSFMDDILNVGCDLFGCEIQVGTDPFKVIRGEKYEKVQLFKAFVQTNHDFNNPKFKQRLFTRWIRMYCEKLSVALEEVRINGKDYFIFS
ncbi:MAG: hypothetical protein WC389_13220 [Lutibacter sp.]|jgi:hypothetical protein